MQVYINQLTLQANRVSESGCLQTRQAGAAACCVEESFGPDPSRPPPTTLLA